MSLDVLAFGEPLLRLQPEGEGRLEDAPRFLALPGGAEVNTCCALAALGLRCAFFSLIPEGPLGRRVLRHLRAAGVDTTLVRRGAGRMGTYWLEYGRAPRTIEVLYDRRDSAVTQVRAEDVPWEALRASRVFYVTGITPSLGPGPRAVALEMAQAARAAGITVAVDINYRSRLWPVEEAAPVLQRLAASADVLISTEDDLRLLFGGPADPEGLGRHVRQALGVRRLVLTRGGEGALDLDGAGVRQAAAFPCTVVDRVGAGDAFSAGLLYALLTGQEGKALEYALAMAALKHSLAGDTLLTTPEELERVVSGRSGDIRR